MSITHDKKDIILLNLLINYISVRSAPQILSIEDQCTFLFLNFLIIGLRNSSANSLFEIISILKSLPPNFIRVDKVSDRKVSDRALVEESFLSKDL